VSLNTYRDEAGKFLQAVDPGGREGDADILAMLDKEVAELKASVDDSRRLSHQVYDVLFVLFELAGKKGLDLDAEWTRGREKKRKYTDESPTKS